MTKTKSRESGHKTKHLEVNVEEPWKSRNI